MQFGGLPALHAQVLHALTQQLASNHFLTAGRNEFTVSLPSVEEANATFYAYVRNDIAQVPLDEETEALVKKAFFNHDFLFLMKVVVPMWMLCGKNCFAIYHKATEGKIQALDTLLRFDKMQVQNPRINKWIYFYASSKNKHKLSIVLDAIAGRPRKRITLRRVKYLLAGYISVGSELLGHRLTAPEIQSLFDAVAVDYGIDDLRDPDLPESPEAFSKAVQRERDFWLPILFPNRTK